MKNSSKKRKIKKLLSIVAIVAAIAYCAILFYTKNKSQKEVYVVKINKEKISKEDISQKIYEIFSINSADIKVPEIDNLPQEVLETFAKEIYLEKQLLKKAKKAGVANKEDVKRKIEQAKNRILIESYLQYQISANVSEEKIKDKYLEISNNGEGKKEYLLSHILLKNENEASKIYRLYQENQSEKNFAELAKKYSIDKTNSGNGGKLGYIQEDDVAKEILDQISSFKKGMVSLPIKTQFGWHIVKVEDFKDIKIDSFEESKDKIRQDMTKKTTDQIYEDIFGDVKIKFLLKKNNE